MTHLKNNFIQTCALIIFYSVIFIPQSCVCQGKYDFNFYSQWTWGDLIDRVVIINPELMKSVDRLKNKTTVENARIILKELSGLDSLNYIKKLTTVSNKEVRFEKNKWDSILNNSLDSVLITEDFSGLLNVALRLSEIRRENSKIGFQFMERDYLPQPVKDYYKNISVKFDYSGAEEVLKFFNDNSNSVDGITETEPYKILFNDKSIDEVSKYDLGNFLSVSSEDNSLSSIYKWVNPSSFWNLGGVSIYKQNFATILNMLRQNESNIKSDVEKHLSEYISDSVFFEVEIFYLFGKKSPESFCEKNKLGINLEYFGDDYDYLIRFIQHEVFLLALKEIQLPVEEFAVENSDRKFVNMISNSLKNGTANYIGPVGTQTRPWHLLEKDFQLFNKTFKNIYKNNSGKLADSLISSGYSGDAPFYTMTTQMAYIIETTLGRNALIQAIKYGPVFFFSKYIDAYKEYPDKIRKVFTFSRELEDKISDLKNLFPDELIKDALSMKKFRSNTDSLNEQVSRFLMRNYDKNNDRLKNLLSGYLLLESDDFKNAENLFLKGISGNSNEGKLAGELGDLFYTNGAHDEAREFYDLFTENSPDDASAYEKRGIFFYKQGNIDKARNDFEKALVINPGLHNSQRYLTKINQN